MVNFNFEIPKISKRSWIRLIILLILLISVPFGIYLSQKTQIFRPRAATVRSPIYQLTDELTQARNRNDLNAMIDISERRKFLLIKQFYSDPQSFLNEATLYQYRDSFPEKIRGNIEERIDSRGTLTAIYIDPPVNESNFTKTEGKLNYTFTDFNNPDKQYLVRIVGDIPDSYLEYQSNLRGVSLENWLVTKKDDVSSLVTNRIFNRENFSKGEKKLAIFLVNLFNNQATPFSKDQIANLFFNDQNSVASYFNRVSNKKFTLTGDIYGWYTLSYKYPFTGLPLSGEPEPGTGNTCEILSPLVDPITRDKLFLRETLWQREALGLAYDQGVNLNSYDLFLFIFPNNTICSSLGIGSIGVEDIQPFSVKALISGNVPITFYKPTASIYGKQLNLQPYIHEIGHNLGLHHANSIFCTPDNSINSTCSKIEYGDLTSPMSYYDSFLHDTNKNFEFNSVEKIYLDWISEDSTSNDIKFLIPLQTETDSIYSLAPYEWKNKTNIPKVIYITLPGVVYDGLYISYRTKDAFTPELINPGITVHLGPPLRSYGYSFASPIKKYLIFPKNYQTYTITEEHPTFEDGDSFTDPLTGITVTQISHNANEAKVKISIKQISSPQPSIQLSPQPSSSSNNQISQIFVDGRTLYGPGALSCSTSQLNCVTINLSKKRACEQSGDYKIIDVNFPDISLGYPLIFKAPSNSSICSSGTAVSLAPKPSAPEYSCDQYRSDQANIKWNPVANAYKYKLFIDDLSDGRQLSVDDPNCLNSNLEDKCRNTTIPDTRENPIITYLKPGIKYKIWIQSYDVSNNLSEPSDKIDLVCGDLTPRILNSGRKVIDFPCYGGKPGYKPLPVRKKNSKQCFYSATTCYDNEKFDVDFSCDSEHLYTRDDFSVKSASLSDLGLISPPQFTQASCDNGVLNILWKDGGPKYELRAGKNLTKADILPPPDGNGVWDSSHPIEGDIVGRDLTSSPFTQNVGADNQSYIIWIHSKNQYGVGERVFYPTEVVCRSNQPSQSSILPQFTKAECKNGVINISWTGSGSSYELRGGMNLTQSQILDGTTWDNGHPNVNDLVARNLTSTSFSKNVGANNQYYTIWIHSRNSSAVLSDRVFYPEKVYCK